MLSSRQTSKGNPSEGSGLSEKKKHVSQGKRRPEKIGDITHRLKREQKGKKALFKISAQKES